MSKKINPAVVKCVVCGCSFIPDVTLCGCLNNEQSPLDKDLHHEYGERLADGFSPTMEAPLVRKGELSAIGPLARKQRV